MITIKELNQHTTVFGPVEIRMFDDDAKESRMLYESEDGIFCDDDLYQREIMTMYSDGDHGIVLEVAPNNEE
ncbi:MAG: hypothetical protein RSG23_08690 [Gordonibacter sp.]|uniref:hypothetical protein n=1 Tax=Gordonibacter sp. TaxID=1968902 RepID=UPI002FCC433B